MSKVQSFDQFKKRHIGPDAIQQQSMLHKIGVQSLDQLIEETVPASIRMKKKLRVPEALSEFEYLRDLKSTAQLNKVFQSFIGMGYHGTITPSVILRNVFQNPRLVHSIYTISG